MTNDTTNNKENIHRLFRRGNRDEISEALLAHWRSQGYIKTAKPEKEPVSTMAFKIFAGSSEK